MSRVFISRFRTVLALFSLFACGIALNAQSNDSHRPRKYKAPPPAASIQVTVLKADTGKAIRDAHVIFHPVEGERDKGSMELKTDEDGQIKLDIIPIGDTVRLQVIADGYQTYGDDYKVDQPRLSWEVCLRRPGPQYSIYTNHPTKVGATTCPANISHQNSGAGSGDSSSEPQSPAPPSTNDKPSNSASQPEPQPNASQPQSN